MKQKRKEKKKHPNIKKIQMAKVASIENGVFKISISAF